jgi:hypothetical protein
MHGNYHAIHDVPEQAANQNTMFRSSRFFPTGREASDADAMNLPGDSSRFPRVLPLAMRRKKAGLMRNRLAA